MPTSLHVQRDMTAQPKLTKPQSFTALAKLLVPEIRLDIEDATQPPLELPDHVQAAIAYTLEIEEQQVRELWGALRAVIWHDERSATLVLKDAVICRLPSRLLRWNDDQPWHKRKLGKEKDAKYTNPFDARGLGPIMFYPPFRLCATCGLHLTDPIRRPAVLFTNDDANQKISFGSHPVWMTSTYCRGGWLLS